MFYLYKKFKQQHAESQERIVLQYGSCRGLYAVQGKSLVHAWRKNKGLSQKELAHKLNISQSAFSQMEKPEAALRRSTLEKIAAVLDISVEQLQY